MEAVLKAYRTPEKGATTPKSKVLPDGQGNPIRTEALEAVAQDVGFRPKRLAPISGEYNSLTHIVSLLNQREIGGLMGIDYSSVSIGRKRLQDEVGKTRSLRKQIEKIKRKLSPSFSIHFLRQEVIG